jgi:outer membrane receptor protein involved in Fe transport
MTRRHAFALIIVLGAAPLQRTALGQEGGAETNVLTPADVEETQKDSTELSLAELQTLDLEQLLKINVGVGNLTKSNALTTPASVTTITEEDIRLTPARNLVDLLEVYVPGASFRIHSEGLHPGIRGIISDRNYKFLLLVDGKVMNQKAHGGVVTELENWDMTDIAQIDVLRGPGSVTYGPGAIAGVINITTKNARKFNGTSARLIYNYPYGASGAAFEHSFKNEVFEMYAYASRVSTPGTYADTYQTDVNNFHGFLYQTPAFSERPAPFYGDFNGTPQVKAHLDLRFKKEWTLWARYTSQGMNAGTTTLGTANSLDRFQTGQLTTGGTIFGPPFANKGISTHQATVTLANEHKFGKILTLKPMVSLSSQDFRRRINEQRAFATTDSPFLQKELVDPDNLRYYGQKFAESQLFLRLLANLAFHKKLRAAFGVEYAYEHFGPAWGDTARDFRMGDANNIISGTDSQAYGFGGGGGQPNYNGVNPYARWVQTSGWGSHTVSGLGEVNLQIHRLLGILVSARVDRNNRSATLFSPRVAIVSQLNDNNVLKLIYQRAQRMNTAEQLLYQRVVNAGNSALDTAEPEVIDGYEASFSTLPTQNLNFTLTGFYNQLKVIGFNTNTAASQVVGRLKLAGAEIEAAYSSKRFKVGVNHSFVKQIKWQLDCGPDGVCGDPTANPADPALKDDVLQSGISYADFKQRTTQDDPTVLIQGFGNDLANWANQSTKLFIHARFSTWLLLHVDSRIFWGEQGQKDALSALQTAADASGGMRTQAITDSIQALKDQGAYDIDFRLNASAHFLLSPSFTVGIYGQNLCWTCGNKRYGYDAGLVRAAPIRSIFVREPLTVGANATYSW